MSWATTGTTSRDSADCCREVRFRHPCGASYVVERLGVLGEHQHLLDGRVPEVCISDDPMWETVRSAASWSHSVSLTGSREPMAAWTCTAFVTLALRAMLSSGRPGTSSKHGAMNSCHLEFTSSVAIPSRLLRKLSSASSIRTADPHRSERGNSCASPSVAGRPASPARQPRDASCTPLACLYGP